MNKLIVLIGGVILIISGPAFAHIGGDPNPVMALSLTQRILWAAKATLFFCGITAVFTYWWMTLCNLLLEPHSS